MPLGSQQTINLKANAIDMVPQFGGQTQRVARLGSKWSLQVAMRSLSYVQGAYYMALLEQGALGLVSAPVPQLMSNSGAGTSVVVDGVAQAGTSITLSGFPANFTIPQGSFFNITTNGYPMLYRTTSVETCNGSGIVTLPINPMLKVSPNNGDACNFASPIIVGFLSSPSQSHTIAHTQTIQEVAGIYAI